MLRTSGWHATSWIASQGGLCSMDSNSLFLLLSPLTFNIPTNVPYLLCKVAFSSTYTIDCLRIRPVFVAETYQWGIISRGNVTSLCRRRNEIRRELEICSIGDKMKEYRARWLDRVQRMDENENSKTSIPVCTERKKGYWTSKKEMGSWSRDKKISCALIEDDEFCCWQN